MKKHNLLLYCLAVFVVWLAYGIIIVREVFKGDFQKSGQFGDTFGVLNTLFTGLAFVVVLTTLNQQSHQIEETKRHIEEEKRRNNKLQHDSLWLKVQIARLDAFGALNDTENMKRAIREIEDHWKRLSIYMNDDKK